MPENTIYVGRPTKWGNPHYMTPASKLDPYSNASALAAYKVYLARNPQLVEAAKKELRGKDLACFCKEGNPCHADILLKLANA